jgi:hypothetical protein
MNANLFFCNAGKKHYHKVEEVENVFSSSFPRLHTQSVFLFVFVPINMEYVSRNQPVGNLPPRRFFKRIWAHFLLRKKPGFAGVPPLARPMATCGGPTPPEANPQDLRPLARLRCPPGGHGLSPSTPRGGTSFEVAPLGVSVIPMIDT